MEVIKSENCYLKHEFKMTEPFDIKKEYDEIGQTKADLDITNNNIKTENQSDIDKAGRNNKVLKRKFTEDGVAIERVLSEGETSSGFETVSSVNSNVDINDLDDLDLSSLSDYSDKDKDNFNVIVQIENELAYQKSDKDQGKRIFYWDHYNSVIHNSGKDNVSEQTKLNGLKPKHLETERSSKEKKYCDRHSDKKAYKREKQSLEREFSNDSKRSRERMSRERDRNTQYHCRKYRLSDTRSRRSRSNERRHRYRDSSSERSVRCRSSSNKGRKMESRHSDSFDKHSSYEERRSSSRKRRRSSFSRSPCSVWSRLDKRTSPARGKREKSSSDKRNSFSKTSQKKERTPFLVELERKLKEAERSKNKEKESTISYTDTQVKEQPTVVNVNDIPMPPPVLSINSKYSSTNTTQMIQLNPNPPFPLSFPHIPILQGMQYYPTLMPTLGMDNLPLVPGPMGLPVHITMTGEQIPYDMDGRRIPVGPNGHYLPLDPTGRLFPHIISPANQAIPVHLNDEGVLCLPNSEPVPFGPGHQLPVNIDGSIIFIGPDSKPLYPYPKVPKEPVWNNLKMMNASLGENSRQTTETIPEVFKQEEVKTQTQPRPQPEQSIDQTKSEVSKTDLPISDSSQNLSEENKNEDAKKKPNEIAEEPAKNHTVYSLQDTWCSSPSKGGVKRSIPMKLTPKKAPKDDVHIRPELSLDLDASVLPQKTSESHKGSTEEVVLSSDEEQRFLTIICGNKSFKIPELHVNSDDPVLEKTQEAIKSLAEKNYRPPVFGRFILSDFVTSLVPKKFPNESPLLRNRIKLPYITPNAKEFYWLKQPDPIRSANVTFKFLPQKSGKGESQSNNQYKNSLNTNAKKFPVFTFDFSMQCDFTSVIIKNLNTKVIDLELEVARLKKINANLLDECKNIQTRNEKKSEELRKALLDLQLKNNEIEALKCSQEEKQ